MATGAGDACAAPAPTAGVPCKHRHNLSSSVDGTVQTGHGERRCIMYRSKRPETMARRLPGGGERQALLQRLGLGWWRREPGSWRLGLGWSRLGLGPSQRELGCWRLGLGWCRPELGLRRPGLGCSAQLGLGCSARSTLPDHMRTRFG